MTPKGKYSTYFLSFAGAFSSPCTEKGDHLDHPVPCKNLPSYLPLLCYPASFLICQVERLKN